jgi:alpha/beta superfamily hydrolase
MAAFLPGPAGPLEMMYRGPESARAAGVPEAAVICHPHPGFGGTMHNKVVYTVARALLSSGLHVLRFNYRGVGASAGRSGKGEGETADIRAAVDWLGERHAGPLLLAGFSFGARFGLQVGLAHPRVERLIGVGLAVSLLQASALEGGDKPVLLVHGDRDAYGSAADVQALAATWLAPVTVRVVPGADHFFAGKLPELQGEVEGWLRA